jgi:hypothetical protein
MADGEEERYSEAASWRRQVSPVETSGEIVGIEIARSMTKKLRNAQQKGGQNARKPIGYTAVKVQDKMLAQRK